MSDSVSPGMERTTDRRGLLALMGATVTAALAGLFSRGRQAEAAHVSGDSALHVGAVNNAANGVTADAETLLNVDRDGIAFSVFNNNNGGALATGIRGSTNGSGPDAIGVLGAAPNGTGTFGSTTTGTGVFGRSVDGVGVRGESVNLIGVLGVCDTIVGVEGKTVSGAGVRGAASGEGTGVLAVDDGPPAEFGNAIALDVIGKARFHTAGDGSIAAGSLVSAPVPAPGGLLTAASRVLVTLAGNPGAGNGFAWVEIDVGAQTFTVHLIRKAAATVPFHFLIVEEGLPLT
jgi:hypothetical protein